MRNLVFLILIFSFTVACGGSKGTTRKGRTVPATPTPAPFGGSLRATSGSVESGVADMGMRASVGSVHQVTSVPDLSAEVSIGVPSSSSQ